MGERWREEECGERNKEALDEGKEEVEGWREKVEEKRQWKTERGGLGRNGGRCKVKR